jgi:hypothetical protein
MTIPLKSILVSGAMLGLVSWGVSKSPDSQLVAMSTSLQSMMDTDNDGLDDVLEVLLGTSMTDADTDNDSLSDLDEHLGGTDPLVFDAPGRPAPISRELKVDVYSNGADVVVQISGLFTQGISGLKLFAANETRFAQIRPRLLAAFQSDSRSFSSNIANLSAKVYRIKLPAQFFHNSPAMAIGATANLDGVGYGSQSQLLSYANHLIEYRDAATFGRSSQSGGGSTGGLFPTSPGGSMPGEISLGQVCVQSLQEIASLGGGQKLYQVADSYCDYLPNAACFSSCAGAIGNSVVGIDIVGLLGG